MIKRQVNNFIISEETTAVDERNLSPGLVRVYLISRMRAAF